MKKIKTLVVAAATVVLSGCGGGDILTGVLGGLTGTDGNTISGLGNVIMSVLGANQVSEAGLVGSWRYTNPGVAFTSSNVLAQAGGEVVAQQIENKLLSVYNSVGIKVGPGVIKIRLVVNSRSRGPSPTIRIADVLQAGGGQLLQGLFHHRGGQEED